MIHSMSDVGRREFVALAAVTPALAAARFDGEDARWIEALMEQIVPEDDVAGARKAGCLHYLEVQLAGPLKRFVPEYQEGLMAFQKAYPKFLDLGFAEQTRVLETMPRNAFFEMLIDHTMQAFYGSPEHGGNRDEASWKMMGIEKYMGGGHWHGA
jgi:gluconate 2-dehydrogenase gamma chain